MTGPTRRAAALAVLLLALAGCDGAPATPAADPGPGPLPDTTTVTPTRLQAVQLVGETRAGQGPPAGATFSPAALTVGKEIGPDTDQTTSSALAFAPLVTTALCIDRARLVVEGADAVGSSGEQLRVYPSAALSLAEGTVPPNGDAPTALLDNRPVGTSIPVADGSLTYDVSELVRRWVVGGPFPSQERTLAVGTPFVLVLRVPDLSPGQLQVRLPVTDSSPRLEIDVVTGCLPPGS